MEDTAFWAIGNQVISHAWRTADGGYITLCGNHKSHECPNGDHPVKCGSCVASERKLYCSDSMVDLVNYEQYIGAKFGKYTILKFLRKRNNSMPIFLVSCECGKEYTRDRIVLFRSQSKEGVCDCLVRPAYCQNLYSSYRNSAIKRGYSFNISIEFFWDTIQQNCHYCGCPPMGRGRSFKKDKSDARRYNGVDRVDNTKGYDVSNCVPCCKKCNYAKSDMAQDEFYEWIDRLIAHNLQAKSAARVLTII